MKIHNEELLNEFYKHEKLNVAIFSDIYFPSIGGVTFVVDNLAKSFFHKQNCNVVVITGEVKNHIDKTEYPIIRCKSIPIPKSMGDSLPLPKLDRKFNKLINSLNIDVVHIHSVFGMCTFGIKFAKKHNIPAIFHGHSKMYDEYLAITNSKFIARVMGNRAFRLMDKTDTILAVSNITKQVYLNHGVKKKITVVSNATDMTPCDNKKEAFEYMEQKHGISKTQENVLVFVENMVYRKKRGQG